MDSNRRKKFLTVGRKLFFEWTGTDSNWFQPYKTLPLASKCCPGGPLPRLATVRANGFRLIFCVIDNPLADLVVSHNPYLAELLIRGTNLVWNGIWIIHGVTVAICTFRLARVTSKVLIRPVPSIIGWKTQRRQKRWLGQLRIGFPYKNHVINKLSAKYKLS